MSTPHAKLPAINIPPNVDGQLRVTLEAMKERLEVREGSRGNPQERAATMRDLELLTQSSQATTSTTQSSSVDGGLTPEQARAIFNKAMSAESSRLRNAIATVDREMRDAMDRLINGDGGVSALQAMAFSGVARYTPAQLADDLAAGAATIIAGAASGTTVMELDPAGNYVLFKHRDADLNATAGGAAYTGMVRTAVGITAAGVIAGFNRQSDGAWQTSIVIDSSTGDVTILGTLKAGSVIEAGAMIGIGGMLLGDLETLATQAESDAAAALAAADAADTKATDANNAVADMASDSQLSPVEKKAIRAEWDAVISSEKASLNAQASTFAVTTENTTYNSAFQALATYLNAGVAWVSGVPSWIADANLGTTTAIVGATFRATAKTFYDARIALLNAIALKAKTLADNAQSSANSAIAGLSDTLSASSSNILTGTIVPNNSGGIKVGTISWNSTTGALSGGSGIAITEAGIIGAKAGAATFTIDTAGTATFAGDIRTGGDAYFSGKTYTTSTIRVSGTNYPVDYSSWSHASTAPSDGSTIRAGAVGYASASASAYSVGSVGIGIGTTRGIGVVGNGDLIGGYFSTAYSTGVGVQCINTQGNLALDVYGTAAFNSSITAAGNITAYSDLRLKKDLKVIDNALNKVRKLTGYTYARKDTGERQTGLVAQDVKKVIPEAVQEGEYLSIAYGNLIGLLVEAIKELDAKIDRIKL